MAGQCFKVDVCASFATPINDYPASQYDKQIGNTKKPLLGIHFWRPESSRYLGTLDPVWYEISRSLCLLPGHNISKAFFYFPWVATGPWALLRPGKGGYEKPAVVKTLSGAPVLLLRLPWSEANILSALGISPDLPMITLQAWPEISNLNFHLFKATLRYFFFGRQIWS